jgi:L-malate glycosyltransferase
MQNQIVVIAFASTAIPETLKKGGILIYKKDFPQIAELMNQISEKPDIYRSTLKTQERALDFYRNYPFQEKLENIFFNQERVNL